MPWLVRARCLDAFIIIFISW